MSSCVRCDMCGKEASAELSCTLAPGGVDGKVEKACWCVCPECKEKFDQDVRSPIEDEVAVELEFDR